MWFAAALGVSGAFYRMEVRHEAELAVLREDCDSALARSEGGAARIEDERDRYIAQLERDARALLASRAALEARQDLLLESDDLDLDRPLSPASDLLSLAPDPYSVDLAAASAQIASVGEQLASLSQENERLSHLQDGLLSAFGDRILAYESLRRTSAEEVQELTRTLAYEQWRKTVYIAVQGECKTSWGAKKFNTCARRVEASLLPYERDALRCIIGGYGLPFYTADQQLKVFPDNSVVLKEGVVVPCDLSLRDQDLGPVE